MVEHVREQEVWDAMVDGAHSECHEKEQVVWGEMVDGAERVSTAQRELREKQERATWDAMAAGAHEAQQNHHEKSVWEAMAAGAHEEHKGEEKSVWEAMAAGAQKEVQKDIRGMENSAIKRKPNPAVEAAKAIMKIADSFVRDGQLSCVELKTFLRDTRFADFGEWLTKGMQKFSSYDSNKDGTIDIMELQMAIEEFQALPKAPVPKMKGSLKGAVSAVGPHDHGLRTTTMHRQPMFPDRHYDVSALEDFRWTPRWVGRSSRANQELPTFDRIYFDRPDPRNRLSKTQMNSIRVDPTWKRIQMAYDRGQEPIIACDPRVGSLSLQYKPLQALRRARGVHQAHQAHGEHVMNPKPEVISYVDPKWGVRHHRETANKIVQPIRKWPKARQVPTPGRVWCREASTWYEDSRRPKGGALRRSISADAAWSANDEEGFQRWWKEQKATEVRAKHPRPWIISPTKGVVRWVNNHESVKYEDPQHESAMCRCLATHTKDATPYGEFDTPSWLPPLPTQEDSCKRPNFVKSERPALS